MDHSIPKETDLAEQNLRNVKRNFQYTQRLRYFLSFIFPSNKMSQMKRILTNKIDRLLWL